MEDILTIKTNVMISHDPLIMYVFHVIFVSAMGMTNVRSKLKQKTLAEQLTGEIYEYSR